MGLLTSKDISATSVGPLIIPSLIGGDLSQIKNNCNRMTSVLSDILNNAIDSMWRKTFQKEKKEIAYGAEDNANRMEEEEIEMINQKILRAKKEKEARLEAARLREIEFLAERNRLAKERNSFFSFWNVFLHIESIALFRMSDKTLVIRLQLFLI